jgi:hypothetical protein
VQISSTRYGPGSAFKINRHVGYESVGAEESGEERRQSIRAALRSAHGLDPSAHRRRSPAASHPRFGGDVQGWLDELPGVLNALGQRWQFELGPAIPRGSMSIVFGCRMADGRRAVIKAQPRPRAVGG